MQPQPLSLSNAAAERRQPIRFIAIGDALVEPCLYRRTDGNAKILSYRSNSVLTWLRSLAPQIDLDDAAIFSEPGETTVSLAERLPSILSEAGAVDAALVSVGLQDCFQQMESSALSPQASIAALQMIVDGLIDTGVRPFVLVPPPCPQFSNGLFADRYLAISASLRRMARQRPAMTLIDATDELKGANASGIEPEKGYTSDDAAGRLLPAGALRLARLAAASISAFYGFGAGAQARIAARADGAINSNPLLSGSSGHLESDASCGSVPEGYRLDAINGGGIRAFGATSAAHAEISSYTLTLHGRYASAWPFIRVTCDLTVEELAGFETGDIIEAFAEYEIVANRKNLAFVAFQLTPVWRTGFIGLASGEFDGAPLVDGLRHAIARTPKFTVQAPLDRLSLSFIIYFTPGDDLYADATLVLRSVVVRKATQT